MNVDYFDFENYEYFAGLEENVSTNENSDGNFNDEEEEENDEGL